MHAAERNHNDFSRKNKVRSNRPLDLFTLQHYPFFRTMPDLPDQLLVMRLVFRRGVKPGMKNLLRPLKAQIGSAQHQQRSDRPGEKGHQKQGNRNNDGLVERRPLRYRPDHGQLARRADAGYLMGIQRNIIPQHPRCFFGRHFG